MNSDNNTVGSLNRCDSLDILEATIDEAGGLTNGEYWHLYF